MRYALINVMIKKCVQLLRFYNYYCTSGWLIRRKFINQRRMKKTGGSYEIYLGFIVCTILLW